jgi:fatty-acyl-CoA synthase
MVGGAIVVLQRFHAARMLSAIEIHKATWIFAVPTMTIAMLDEAEKGNYDLSSLRAIHSAAAPTPRWVWRKIKDVFGVEDVFTSYGQTETSMITCTLPGDSLDVVSLTQGALALGGAAGIPALGHHIADIRIINLETGQDAPAGVTGELCTKGPTNAMGYFRNPTETAALFTPDGWLKMGDLGYFREDGNLLLMGRSKEVFKSRGELVAPQEIEAILTTHPGISQAFVIGMPDERSGECGCAWIVRADPSLEFAAIASFLETRVARYKMLRDIWFIEDHQLPKTGTGKIQKVLLKDRALKMLLEPEISHDHAS